jgi:superfamily II DNA/RNA helicase
MPALSDALADQGITSPFPVQQMAIPVALTGADLIGQARTGTGKTLAFGLPLLQRIVAPDEPDYVFLAAPDKPQALVVCPTRELALQVTQDIERASTRRRVRVLSVFGGRSHDPQVDALRRGVDVVVGTPGRLLDLARQAILDLGHVKVVVLDEADEMLDLGFLPDVETILGLTPELRQSMLFSATMPSSVITLARRYMRHPVNVRAESPDETATVPATAQFVYRAHRMDKDEVLARILQAENRDRVMIFARTKRQAQSTADELAHRGFAVAAVHGDLNQQAREKALASFRAGTVDVLVATDVAARGIDVEGVTHVVNATCPEDEKTYLHRIGRTGRAGASGVAITLVDWEDLSRWSLINAALDLPYPDPPETYSTSEHLYHDLGIPRAARGRLPGAPEGPRERPADRGSGSTGRDRSRGRSGARGSGGSSRGQAPRRRQQDRSSEDSSQARAQVGTSTSEPAVASGPGQAGSATGEGPGSPRRRRRRRTRGGAPVSSGSSPQPSTDQDGPTGGSEA